MITPTIASALRRAEPLEGIRHYGFPASIWKHFERLPRLPRGVLPIADALCRFNPIFGQGMTAAAKQARLLRTMLGEAAYEPGPRPPAAGGVSVRFNVRRSGDLGLAQRARPAFRPARAARSVSCHKLPPL